MIIATPARCRTLLWWLAGLLLFLALGTAYLSHRQQVFEWLAAGTEWVLVTCGFVPENDSSDGGVQTEQLRKLYYAARMFNSPPPKEISEADARAEAAYPGVGFGLVHTFSRRPVERVVGGWLFSIPCTYFIDARNCEQTRPSARLKLSVDELAPISDDSIEDFLAVDSPAVMRMTIAGVEWRGANWWRREPTAPPYDRYTPHGTEVYGGVLCVDPLWAKEKAVMDHCLLRFMYGEDVFVELRFAAVHRDRALQLAQSSYRLVDNFLHRQ